MQVTGSSVRIENGGGRRQRGCGQGGLSKGTDLHRLLMVLNYWLLNGSPTSIIILPFPCFRFSYCENRVRFTCMWFTCFDF